MSVAASHWARMQRAGSPSNKLVLMILADYADEAGSCFPSRQTIADQAEISVRTVQRALLELEAADLITWVHRQRDGGMQTSSRYTLQLPQAEGTKPSPQNASGSVETSRKDRGSSASARSAKMSPPVCQNVTPGVPLVAQQEPPLNLSEEEPPYPPRGDAHGHPADQNSSSGSQWDKFNSVWQWQLTEAKGKAKRAFDDLTADQQTKATAAAPAYHMACRAKQQSHRMHAAGWLRNEGWATAEACLTPNPNGEAKMVVIERGTPEFRAWADYLRTIYKHASGWAPATWEIVRADGKRVTGMLRETSLPPGAVTTSFETVRQESCN